MNEENANDRTLPKPKQESLADTIEREVAEGKLQLSAMGRRLLDARRRIEQSGIPLLTNEELDRERLERRGCRADEFVTTERPGSKAC